MKILALVLAGLWLAGLVAAPAASAAEAPGAKTAKSASPAGGLSSQELEDLVGTLEDEAKRKEFLKTLKAVLQARSASAADKPRIASSLLSGLSERAKTAAGEVVDAAAVLLKAGALWHWIGTQWNDPF